MKRCIGCGEVHPNGHFYKIARNEDGLHKYCKDCCKVNRALEAVRRRDRKSRISLRQKHRALNLGIELDATVNLAEVFKRARGVCGICGDWVKPSKASMDHVTPLARGGTHTYANIQLTHLICNLRKGHSEDY